MHPSLWASTVADMISLKGQFLVAMPEMGDERFHEAVIYIIGHGEDGAMGLVVNHAVEDMRFGDVLRELNLGNNDEIIALPRPVRERTVVRGGPVQKGRGFVLHSMDYFHDDASFAVADGVCLTATLEVLRALAFGPAPKRALFVLGYCGWAPSQLEAELGRNGWLTVPYSDELMFGLPLEARYDAALALLGVTRASLSSEAGHG